jgi:putative tryptophan/tyrosine transport system substrate-binding protein
MRRREVIALLGGVAVGWPLAARAQQADRARRVGVLMGYAEADPGAKELLAEFTQALSEFGWIEGRNLRLEIRWAPANADLMRTFAKELVSLQPDVILTNSTPITTALKRETSTIPIVFAVVADPVGSGFVASLPRPGGNITGFSSMEGSMASKWLELLTAIAPNVKRAVMMFNPDTAPFIQLYALPSFEAAARLLKVASIAAPVHNDTEIEAAMAALARESGSGLLGMPDISSKSTARSSYRWQREIIFLRSTRHLLSPEMAVCSPTELTSKIYFTAVRATSITFSVAQSRLSFLCSCLRNI